MRRRKKDFKRHQILLINSKGFFSERGIIWENLYNDILFIENFQSFIVQHKLYLSIMHWSRYWFILHTSGWGWGSLFLRENGVVSCCYRLAYDAVIFHPAFQGLTYIRGRSSNCSTFYKVVFWQGYSFCNKTCLNFQAFEFLDVKITTREEVGRLSRIYWNMPYFFRFLLTEHWVVTGLDELLISMFRSYREKLIGRCFCYFKAATLVPLRRTSTWRSHTRLNDKSCWNIPISKKKYKICTVFPSSFTK